MKAEREIINVAILTEQYRLVGNIHVVPGGRITDFLVSKAGGNFIPVTDVKMFSAREGKLISETKFLVVNSNFIVILYPLKEREASNEIKETKET